MLNQSVAEYPTAVAALAITLVHRQMITGLDSDILTLLGMDNDGGMDIGRSCDVASSSNGNRGKDLTLRQLGISGFANLGYVDVRVFARNNLTVRSASKLHEIKSPEEFIAAWSSYIVELQ